MFDMPKRYFRMPALMAPKRNSGEYPGTEYNFSPEKAPVQRHLSEIGKAGLIRLCEAMLGLSEETSEQVKQDLRLMENTTDTDIYSRLGQLEVVACLDGRRVACLERVKWLLKAKNRM